LPDITQSLFLAKKSMRTLLPIFMIAAMHSWAQPSMPVSATITLTLQSTDGTNGCAVVWCPARQTYYTIMAGNSAYPIDRFNGQGKWLGQQASGTDNRGLWFDQKRDKLMGRSLYGELVEWVLDADGQITDPNVIGTVQPDESQSVACGSSGLVYLYNQGVITKYSTKGKKLDAVNLTMDDASRFNATSFGITGIKDYEYVLMDVANGMLAFFNQKGKRTASLTLPASTPHIEKFRFSYTNEMVWLFDADARTWHGYKIF
jgi:hypothetical protein